MQQRRNVTLVVGEAHGKWNYHCPLPFQFFLTWIPVIQLRILLLTSSVRYLKSLARRIYGRATFGTDHTQYADSLQTNSTKGDRDSDSKLLAGSIRVRCTYPIVTTERIKRIALNNESVSMKKMAFFIVTAVKPSNLT
jgi:hypothetical protein